MSATGSGTVSYGNPWAALATLLFVLGCLAGQAALATILLIGGAHVHRAAPFVTGLLFAPLLVVELIVIVIVLVRHPSRLWRVIRLSPTALELPNPKWRSVPVNDISGVALARRTKAQGSNRGTWTPIFWRTDGTHAWVGGLGFSTSKKDPSGTKPARIVTEISERLAQIQGPDGPLLAQHHPGLSMYGSFDKLWDPAASGGAPMPPAPP